MSIIKKYNETSLVLRIVIGLIVGLGLALIFPKAQWIGMFGTIFVGALKAVAPVLVFVLIASSLCQSKEKMGKQFHAAPESGCQPGGRYCQRKLSGHPVLVGDLRCRHEERIRSIEELPERRFRCCYEDDPLGHQFCSLWYYGSDVQCYFHQRNCNLHRLRKTGASACWMHAGFRTRGQSAHCFHLHSQKPISAGFQMSEKQRYHRILHQKLCS